MSYLVPRNLFATLAIPALKVTVRSAFYNPGEGECWTPGKPLIGVTFQLNGVALPGVSTTGDTITTGVGVVPRSRKLPAELQNQLTREVGLARIPFTSLPEGQHVLKVIPPAGQSSPARAGTATLNTAAVLYRPFEIEIFVEGNRLTGILRSSGVTHGYVPRFNHSEMAIDLKPVWMRVPYGVGALAQTTPLRCIVIHHTSEQIMGPGVNTVFNDRKGPHYEIDLDGHVVKFVEDNKRAPHAAQHSYWKGWFNLNASSIGIETTNQSGPFTDETYTSLIALLGDLTANLGISKGDVVGHSDVRTGAGGDPMLLNVDKESCPGRDFDWGRLLAAGYGFVPKAQVPPGMTEAGFRDWVLKTIYGGFFHFHPTANLRSQDSDAARRWGGQTRNDLPLSELQSPMAPIEDLQDRLGRLGYPVKKTNVYDPYTMLSVNRFQRHVFSGPRQSEKRDSDLGIFDKATAWELYKVMP